MKLAMAMAMTAALSALLSAARPLGMADPAVALDFAKQQLAAGRLTDALDLLAAVPPADPAETYLNEEVLVQQILVQYALLAATHSIFTELEAHQQTDSAYAKWLWGERWAHAAELKRLSEAYLAATAGGAQLEFVRFALPRITEEHLQDTELYTDEAIVGAAVTNWEEGREGLGRGLIATQSRVALVLGAAVHYDLPQAAEKLEQIEARLRRGVPFHEATLLDWLIRATRELARNGDGLAELADELEQRRQQPPAAASGGNAAADKNIPAGEASGQS